MRALVVEDQRQMRTIVRKMLQQMKYFQSVEEADDGEKAWIKISESQEEGRFDLVLSDVNMPELDGLGLLRRCREHPEYRFIPFIMISASSHGATVVSTLGEWGAYDFIVKPFSYEALHQRVSSLIKRIQSPEESLYRQAAQLMREGGMEDALKLIDHWERESRLSQAKWLNLKGECLLEMGEEEKAAAQFENAMTISNIYVTAYKNFAQINQKLGNVDKAIKALKYVEELSPTNADRTISLGRLLLKAGRDEEGKQCFEGLMKRSTGKAKEAVAKEVAEVYLDGGLFKEAETMYGAMLGHNPGDLDIVNRLGIALRQQGKLSEAERVYISALKSHPKHAGLYHNLGVVFMAQKVYDRAEKCFKRALDLDPNFGAAHELLENLKKALKR
jgi:two-component system chemotaxis response regulator CheY